MQDCFAGADPEYRVPIRIVTELAWQSLFARNMFVRPDWTTQAATHVPEFTVINAANFEANPEIDGTNSSTFILMDFGRKLILIQPVDLFDVRQYFLCGRDEEVYFHSAQLSASVARCAVDALLSEHRA